MDFAAWQSASNDDRIDFIKRDRWVPTAQATQASWHIRHAFTQPDVLRPFGALVWGPSNSGKSALLTHCIQKYARQLGEAALAADQDQDERPSVLFVPSPDQAEKSEIVEAILEAIDPFFTWSGRRFASVRTGERDALAALRQIQPRALVFDDLSNLTVARGQGQRVSLNFLRRLARKSALVCAGTEAVHSVLRADEQLKERFAFVQLTALKDAELKSFVRKYSGTFPLRRATGWTDEMFDQVMRLTDGLVGRVAMVLKASATLAIEEGHEAITLELLKSAQVSHALASMQKLQAAKRQGRAVA